MIYQTTVRIYYQDTDAGGIVYHSNYLDFAERARSDLLREIGLSNTALVNRGVAFVLRQLNIMYKAPAKLDDDLCIQTTVREIKNASMIMEQRFFRDDKELVSITLQLAFVNPDTLAPIRIPEDIKNLFRRYLIEGE